MIDPLAYAYTAYLRRAAANGADMDYAMGNALAMVGIPLLPPLEAIGRIGWWLCTGDWPTTQSAMLIGRKVSGLFAYELVVMLLVAFLYHRKRTKLLVRFDSFPIPTTRQIFALVFGVIGATVLIGYWCLSKPGFGLSMYAAVFVATSWQLSRMERSAQRITP